MQKTLAKIKKTFKTSKRLLGILWKFNPGLFLGNLLSTSVPAVIPFINAYIYKLIIDAVVASVDGKPIVYSYLLMLIGARIFTLLLQDVSSSLQSYIDNLFWTKFPSLFYQEILGRLSHLDVQQFEDSTFKDRLEKVKESYAWKPLNMLNSIFYSFQSFVQFAIALVAIVALNWMFIIPLVIVASLSLFFQSRFAEASWGIWSSQSPYRKKFWYLSEILQSGTTIKEIKIFELAPRFLEELKSIYTKFDKENTAIAKKQFFTSLFLNVANVGMYIGIEVFVILSAVAKRITIGDITYYTNIISSFQNGINGLFMNISHLFEHGQYVNDMFEVLDTPPVIQVPTAPIKINTTDAPTIEFKNVNFKYPGSKTQVLNDFSLTINPGEKIALVGENGAGKSTIIKLLARFYDVDSGEILVNGVNLKDVDLISWYRCLGILFQDFIKYEFPLSDNIYFGKAFAPKIGSEIIAAAKRSGADVVAKKQPAGYEQMLGKTFESGVELSTGQWQKVALARAFLRNSPLLVLDEPTAAIDARAEFEIFKKVEELANNKTVIIISHRFSTVRNADTIYVIENGKIIESGDHKKLIAKKGVYAELFELQSRGYK